MSPRSLAYRTDLMFFRRGPRHIVDRGDYLAVHAPDNPTFHWGNFLLFRAPPGAGDLARWDALFEAEFRDRPEVQHRTFGWDAPDGATGEIAPFLQAGYQLEDSVVLTTSRVRVPPAYDEQIEIRALETDADWEAATQNQIRCRPEQFDLASYTVFKRRQMALYRELVEAGLGRWFGAFLDGRLAGDLGLFVDDGVGRFQVVGTDPAARGRGVCRTLVHAAATVGFERMGARALVIVAEPEAPAARIYASVGFTPAERQVGLSLWNQSVRRGAARA